MAKRTYDSRNSSISKPAGGHWSLGLLSAMKNPDLIILEDEKVVVIKDAYPKAKFHYLVCPKQDIQTIKQVTKEHLPLLKHMEAMGKKVCEMHKDHTFKLGYHSVPSMVRLHMHVISDDFDSVCLKNKKHWNSFTTEFFVPSEKILKDLEEQGSINLVNRKDAAQQKLRLMIKIWNVLN